VPQDRTDGIDLQSVPDRRRRAIAVPLRPARAVSADLRGGQEGDALDRLRWTTCSHVEADESGALNQWLAAAPKATPAHGQVGCNIWLTDMADRPPRVLKNDEVIDLGGEEVRWLDKRARCRTTGRRIDLRGDHRHAVVLQ